MSVGKPSTPSFPKLPALDPSETLKRFDHLIRHRADSLAQSAGFAKHERDDLEQELRLALLRGLPRFDPQRGDPFLFGYVLIQKATSSMVAKRRASKRFCPNLQSLNRLLDTRELKDLLGSQEASDRGERRTRDPEDLAELQYDLQTVIGQMPDDLAETAKRLMYQSVADLVRESGTPRSTVYARIRSIRKWFERGNLQDFL